ncbi:MAG: galactose mutarotase, partial [Phycisphaerales bacterium]|nr:galactose mutarotase [Phycisphaerales bacterium]
MHTITQVPFGKTAAGQTVTAYTLANGSGVSATILNYGGVITQINVPDKTGKIANVTLGFDNFAQYEKESPYFGAICGRVANRIAKGKFTLDGKTYSLATNNGPNHLHGGIVGYDKYIWAASMLETNEGPSLKLTHTDPDGTEGYPGTVQASITYTLVHATLRITYTATTNKPTPINLTNHAYFNLKDGGKSDVLSHVLQLLADNYTPVDATLIPTGQIASVKNTPIDFTTPKPIGQDLKAMGGDPVGYDHNLVLRSQNGSLAQAAVVTEPTSGRRMEVWTTSPGVQLYTGNFLSGLQGPNGAIYKQHHAFCLETQHFPDS